MEKVFTKNQMGIALLTGWIAVIGACMGSYGFGLVGILVGLTVIYFIEY